MGRRRKKGSSKKLNPKGPKRTCDTVANRYRKLRALCDQTVRQQELQSQQEEQQLQELQATYQRMLVEYQHQYEEMLAQPDQGAQQELPFPHHQESEELAVANRNDEGRVVEHIENDPELITKVKRLLFANWRRRELFVDRSSRKNLMLQAVSSNDVTMVDFLWETLSKMQVGNMVRERFINHIDKFRRNALHYVASAKRLNLELMRSVVEKGIDVDSKTKKQETVIDLLSMRHPQQLNKAIIILFASPSKISVSNLIIDSSEVLKPTLNDLFNFIKVAEDYGNQYLVLHYAMLLLSTVTDKTITQAILTKLDRLRKNDARREKRFIGQQLVSAAQGRMSDALALIQPGQPLWSGFESKLMLLAEALRELALALMMDSAVESAKYSLLENQPYARYFSELNRFCSAGEGLIFFSDHERRELLLVRRVHDYHYFIFHEESWSDLAHFFEERLLGLGYTAELFLMDNELFIVHYAESFLASSEEFRLVSRKYLALKARSGEGPVPFDLSEERRVMKRKLIIALSNLLVQEQERCRGHFAKVYSISRRLSENDNYTRLIRAVLREFLRSHVSIDLIPFVLRSGCSYDALEFLLKEVGFDLFAEKRVILRLYELLLHPCTPWETLQWAVQYGYFSKPYPPLSFDGWRVEGPLDFLRCCEELYRDKRNYANKLKILSILDAIDDCNTFRAWYRRGDIKVLRQQPHHHGCRILQIKEHGFIPEEDSAAEEEGEVSNETKSFWVYVPITTTIIEKVLAQGDLGVFKLIAFDNKSSAIVLWPNIRVIIERSRTFEFTVEWEGGADEPSQREHVLQPRTNNIDELFQYALDCEAYKIAFEIICRHHSELQQPTFKLMGELVAREKSLEEVDRYAYAGLSSNTHLLAELCRKLPGTEERFAQLEQEFRQSLQGPAKKAWQAIKKSRRRRPRKRSRFLRRNRLPFSSARKSYPTKISWNARKCQQSLEESKRAINEEKKKVRVSREESTQAVFDVARVLRAEFDLDKEEFFSLLPLFSDCSYPFSLLQNEPELLRELASMVKQGKERFIADNISKRQIYEQLDKKLRGRGSNISAEVFRCEMRTNLLTKSLSILSPLYDMPLVDAIQKMLTEKLELFSSFLSFLEEKNVSLAKPHKRQKQTPIVQQTPVVDQGEVAAEESVEREAEAEATALTCWELEWVRSGVPVLGAYGNILHQLIIRYLNANTVPERELILWKIKEAIAKNPKLLLYENEFQDRPYVYVFESGLASDDCVLQLILEKLVELYIQGHFGKGDSVSHRVIEPLPHWLLRNNQYDLFDKIFAHDRSVMQSQFASFQGYLSDVVLLNSNQQAYGYLQRLSVGELRRVCSNIGESLDFASIDAISDLIKKYPEIVFWVGHNGFNLLARLALREDDVRLRLVCETLREINPAMLTLAINQPGQELNTAMHLGCMFLDERPSTAEILLKYGGDPFIRNLKGYYPFMTAVLDTKSPPKPLTRKLFKHAIRRESFRRPEFRSQYFLERLIATFTRRNLSELLEELLNIITAEAPELLRKNYPWLEDKTPLQYANEKEFTAIANLLEKYGTSSPEVAKEQEDEPKSGSRFFQKSEGAQEEEKAELSSAVDVKSSPVEF